MSDPTSNSIELDLNEAVQQTVYRIGYRPDPFAWTPWQYAHQGRFDGRWDDPKGNFRTLYVADQLLSCLLEVLADFRPDIAVTAELDQIEEDPRDDDFPTAPAGVIPDEFLAERAGGEAAMSGRFVDVRKPVTIGELRRQFGAFAARLGFPDLDAAALKSSVPRELTQTMSGWFYTLGPIPVDGVAFGSRHGDNLPIWAIYEQPGEAETGSHTLSDYVRVELDKNTPALTEAMRIHGLRWSTDGPAGTAPITLQQWLRDRFDIDAVTAALSELTQMAGAAARHMDSQDKGAATEVALDAVAMKAAAFSDEVRKVLQRPPAPVEQVRGPFTAGLLRWLDAAETIKRATLERDPAGMGRGEAALAAGSVEFERAAAALRRSEQ